MSASRLRLGAGLLAAAACAAASAAAAAAGGARDARFLVWPPARSIRASGAPLPLGDVRVTFDALGDARAASSARLRAAVARFSARVERLRGGGGGGGGGAPRAATGAAALESVSLLVRSADEALGDATSYAYTLSCSPGARGCAAASDSIYGAIYALESLSQLIFRPAASGGGGAPPAPAALVHGSVDISDAPSFAWRGLMLDAGRRFFPMGTLLNLLDTMLAAKLNVLHLHASDECRFGVESKLFPNLTASLSGVLGGFYTQVDVRALIAEAGARGIRVVPEFDVPGHSRGFRPVKGEGVEFCDTSDQQSQLYGDPANSTLRVLQAVLGEMAGLFEDDVFHIGADETGVVGPCTTESTFELERHVLNYLEGPSVNKTVAGWEELLFDAGAATNRTIVYAWSRDTPAQVIDAGRRCVDSQSSHFYLTDAAGPLPGGWASFWYDISTGLTPAQLPSLLGGEMSAWTDRYCYVNQCGAAGGGPPVGAQLFPPSMDLPWSASIAGMIWPRAYVGAAAFWNFDASVSSQDPAFVDAVWALNDRVLADGGLACPTKCACDELTACGVPYVPPPPPPAGVLAVQPCDAGSAAQRWGLSAGSGQLSPAANATLCVLDAASDTYPLALGACGPGAAAYGWRGPPGPAWLVQASTGDCLDMRVADGVVGTYECGSGSGLNQTNQDWWLADPGGAGAIVSAANGGCLTAVLQG